MAIYLWRFEGEGTGKALVAADINTYLASQCFPNDIPKEKAHMFMEYAK